MHEFDERLSISNGSPGIRYENPTVSMQQVHVAIDDPLLP